MKKNVISRKNLPTKSPIGLIILFYLLLDKLNAPQWVWGGLGFLLLFMLIAWIVSLFTEDEIDIFTTKGDSIKSTFQQRLDATMKKRSE